jgi:hypothetical protein
MSYSKAPSTKHQAPEKHQDPNTKRDREHWSLGFGASLELGAWNLELLAIVRQL